MSTISWPPKTWTWLEHSKNLSSQCRKNGKQSQKDVIFISQQEEPPNYRGVSRNYSDCRQCLFVQKPTSYFRTRHHCKLFGLNYGIEGMICDLFHDLEVAAGISYVADENFVIIYRRTPTVEKGPSTVRKIMDRVLR